MKALFPFIGSLVPLVQLVVPSPIADIHARQCVDLKGWSHWQQAYQSCVDSGNCPNPPVQPSCITSDGDTPTYNQEARVSYQSSITSSSSPSSASASSPSLGAKQVSDNSGTPQVRHQDVCTCYNGDSITWSPGQGEYNFSPAPAKCATRGTECSKSNPCISKANGKYVGMGGISNDQLPGNSLYCGYEHNSTSQPWVVALGWPHMGPGGQGNCNYAGCYDRVLDANCGRKILATSNGRSHEAYVVDRCEACIDGLDASDALFSAFGYTPADVGSANSGGRFDVTWYFTD